MFYNFKDMEFNLKNNHSFIFFISLLSYLKSDDMYKNKKRKIELHASDRHMKNVGSILHAQDFSFK